MLQFILLQLLHYTNILKASLFLNIPVDDAMILVKMEHWTFVG